MRGFVWHLPCLSSWHKDVLLSTQIVDVLLNYWKYRLRLLWHLQGWVPQSGGSREATEMKALLEAVIILVVIYIAVRMFRKRG
jgi:hypothetical protein